VIPLSVISRPIYLTKESFLNTLLLETIKIEDGQVANIEWHNKRCNQTRQELFGSNILLLQLQEYINPPSHGLFRCRILYGHHVESVEYIPYQLKTIKTLTIVPSNIEYPYKYNHRKELNTLLETQNSDDIIIEKNGLLTDTTIANIAFYDGSNWLTPKYPLLQGTMRAKLLYEKKLKLSTIRSNDIQKFSYFALMNAMIGFQIQKNVEITLTNKEKICLSEV
jgi:4-amino-4-deoxychorismate lyase